MAIGLVMSLYFTGRNEKPLYAITKAIGGSEYSAGSGDDVYAYIESNIKRLMQENDTISHRMETQRGALKRAFVSGLLRGETGDAAHFVHQCSQYGLEVGAARHCAFILYIHAVPPSVEQSVSGLLDYEDAIFSLLQGAVTRLPGTQEGACGVEITVVDGAYSGWLMLPNDDCAAAQSYLAALKTKLLNEYGVRVSLATGRIYPEYKQLAQSYSEALKALDVLLARGEDGVLRYDEIPQETAPCGGRAIDLISRFANCLRLQDYENALRMLGELFDGYLIGLPSPEAALHRSAVLSIMLDALDQARGLYGSNI
jgi:hypothetical protein